MTTTVRLDGCATGLAAELDSALGSAGGVIPHDDVPADLLCALGAADFGRYFVPVEHGGSFPGWYELGKALRPLFASDIGIGIGYAAPAVAGAAQVLAGGGDEAITRLVSAMLSGERVAYGRSASSDTNGVMLCQRLASSRYLMPDTLVGLPGSRIMVGPCRRTDVERDGNVTVMAVADEPLPVRSSASAILRTAHIDFLDNRIVTDLWPLTPSDTYGHQAASIVVAAGTIAAAEVSLRTVEDFAADRRLYGNAVDRFPHARANLALAAALIAAADATVELAAESFVATASGFAPEVAALDVVVPRLLRESMEYLATVLGARFYLSSGPYAVFGHHYRGIGDYAYGFADAPTARVRIENHIRDCPGLLAGPTRTSVDSSDPLERYIIQVISRAMANRHPSGIRPAWHDIADAALSAGGDHRPLVDAAAVEEVLSARAIWKKSSPRYAPASYL